MIEECRSTFFFPGRYSKATPYYSMSKIHRKTRSKALKPLKESFLFSVKTNGLMVTLQDILVFLAALHFSIANNSSLTLSVVVYCF
jgi:hypothetical protein